MSRTWPSDRNMSKALLAKRKRAAKVFGALDFTPLVSRILAGVCCALAEGPEHQQRAFLSAISKIFDKG